VDWFEKHFARGAYDGVALLGSHALLDEQGCVKSAEIAGEAGALMCCLLPVGPCPCSAPPVGAPVVHVAALPTSQPAGELAGGSNLRSVSCRAAPYKDKQRMFAWNAPNTYYRELAGGGLMGPSADQDSEDYFRTDAPPKVSAAHAPVLALNPSTCHTAAAPVATVVFQIASEARAATSVKETV
jgi:hypothetical protein